MTQPHHIRLDSALVTEAVSAAGYICFHPSEAKSSAPVAELREFLNGLGLNVVDMADRSLSNVLDVVGMLTDEGYTVFGESMELTDTTARDVRNALTEKGYTVLSGGCTSDDLELISDYVRNGSSHAVLVNTENPTDACVEAAQEVLKHEKVVILREQNDDTENASMVNDFFEKVGASLMAVSTDDARGAECMLEPSYEFCALDPHRAVQKLNGLGDEWHAHFGTAGGAIKSILTNERDRNGTLATLNMVLDQLNPTEIAVLVGAAVARMNK